jgi:dCMP deaminase
MRISRHNMWMEMARVVARRGTCPRLCVGAIAVRGRQFSVGYNGAESGAPHCTDVGCLTNPDSQSCIRTKHAEANALKFLPRPQSPQGCLILYVTHSPCMECAEAILEAGVDTVYFETTFRKTEPLAYLMSKGVNVNRLMPNGSIVEGKNGELIEAN